MRGSNKFLILAVLTIMVVIAAVVTTQHHAPTVTTEKDYVFPGLTDKINDVDRIEVTGKDGKLSIRREEKEWVIEQADNYPASFSKVRQAAITLAELKILAEKTSNPGYYSKLGVEDPGGEHAQSKLLTLFDTSGGKLASVIIGKPRMSSAATGSHGYYIRIPGGTRALLVEGDLNINAKPADWFDAEIVNIKPEHISEVVINHPDQKPLRLSRTTTKEDFMLADIPEGKELQSSYTVNRIDSILEGIRVEDVRSADKLKFPGRETGTTIKTFDGMTVTVNSTIIDGANWARFSFDFQSPPVAHAEQQAVPAAEENETATGKDAKPETPSKEKADQIDQKLVVQLTQKTAGWVFKIPSYKFELFTRKLADLVKDKEPEKKEEQQED